MVKSEIRSITMDHGAKILKVDMKCCFVHVITFDPVENRPEFQCDDFWLMIEKLCKKHKIGKYAPSPSLEEEYGLGDILDTFFDVKHIPAQPFTPH